MLFGENMASSAAVDAGVFDEVADADALLQRALSKAEQFAALPRSAFARTKRQLRRAAIEAIETAIAGSEPLLDNWLSRETITAAATVLARKA